MSTTASRVYNFVNDKNSAIPITASRMDGEFDAIITKLNQKVLVKSTTPSGPIEGMQWYDSTNKFMMLYRNSAFDRLDVPAGVVVPYVAATAPTGWLLCDGSAVSRTTYADLFAIISTTYGVGDGSTTFNLPDMQGYFPFGKASSGTGNTLGGTFGAIDLSHTHNAGTLAGPAHTHTVPRDGWGSTATNPDPDGRILTGNGVANAAEEASGDNTSGSSGTGSVTGATAANSALNPPGLVFTFLIKY